MHSRWTLVPKIQRRIRRQKTVLPVIDFSSSSLSLSFFFSLFNIISTALVLLQFDRWSPFSFSTLRQSPSPSQLSHVFLTLVSAAILSIFDFLQKFSFFFLYLLVDFDWPWSSQVCRQFFKKLPRREISPDISLEFFELLYLRKSNSAANYFHYSNMSQWL